MADESLIEEMRVAIRGDRERAEQRRSGAPALASAEHAASPPEEAPVLDEAPQPAVESEPEVVARRRAGWLGWSRRRREL